MAGPGEGNITIRQLSGGSGMMQVAVAAFALGPFVTAFCTELGKRFGGTVADWTSKIDVLHKKGRSARADLLIKDDDAQTVVELHQHLTDEAWLALMDLDIRADAIRGHRLR